MREREADEKTVEGGGKQVEGTKIAKPTTLWKSGETG